MSYDSTQDILNHRRDVRQFIGWLAKELLVRGAVHDDSKLLDPIEKATFDAWTPEMRVREFGTDEYKKALDAMGEGIQRHYQSNSHHPEHFSNGIDGMSLIDLVEMFCDWSAVCLRKETDLDLDTAQKRFNMSDQLRNIFQNTWNLAQGDKTLWQK